MSNISKKDAIQLFGRCKTVAELETCIHRNCHLWYDEYSTLTMLRRCYDDVQAAEENRTFTTILLDGTPYMLSFEIFDNGSVLIHDN